MKKILIVDDEKDILFVLKTYLTQKGFDVVTTLSCDEGLNIFYSVKPDLVLLDVNVGSEDGREMCRTIKDQAEYQHLPVILISANPYALKSYENHGATAVIHKPFDLENLFLLVSSKIK
ncbi:MAG: response regulator [Chitinophagaceae bacterium]